jgi:hypothetical protein
VAAVSTTVTDIISSALRNIGALEAGETPNAQDAADALQVLNDLVEAWSLEHLYIYASTENLLTFTPGVYQYTIGNAPGGTFTGTLVNGSPTISGVTIPANIAVGSFVTDVNAALPANTYVLSFGAGIVTLSANATATVNPAEVFTFTVPGTFSRDAVTNAPIPRPLRINNAFTRITASGQTGLDYGIEIITRDKYAAIGLKGLAGPWPILLYYNPTQPLGNLYFYPNPSSAGSLHLWTDIILSDFSTITTAINLPQGYARALKKNLALELAPEYGKTAGALLVKQAADSIKAIKALNATPAVQAFYDTDLVRSNRTDAGWILHGGFN